MPTQKRVALYIRVSTEEQARQGLSLDAQLEDLQQYAEKHQYAVVGVYTDDGASARKVPFSRKAFKRLLEDVKADRIDRILFIKLDRWFRSVRDYYKAQDVLDEHRVDWETTQEQYNTTTTNGRLMLNVKLSVAQNESDMTSDRINFVFAQKRARHEVCSGSVPLGYKIENKHLVPSEHAGLIPRMFEYFVAQQNISETARWLNAYGFHYDQRSTRAMLRNERYTGKCGDDDEFCPPLVPLSVFQQAQDIFTHNRTVRRNPTGRIYLFSGLLRCPDCGTSLAGLTCFGRTGKKAYRYYKCHNGTTAALAGRCTNRKRIKEENLEERLLEEFDELYKNHCVTVSKKQKSTVPNNADTVKRKLEKLKELFLNDLITLDEYKRDYDTLKKQLPEQIVHPETKTAYAEDLRAGIRPLYIKLGRKQRRQFWHQVLDRIDLDADNNPTLIFRA